MEDNANLLSSSSSSSITLFSRLDHLEFVMKYLEKKQRLEGRKISEGEMEMERSRFISLDVAVKDTFFKGSLLDRVASLEHRLFQLCLEMESGSSSNPSSSSAAEINSSSSSYPTFHYHPIPNRGSGTSQLSQQREKKPQRHEQKKKQESPSKSQLGSGSSKTRSAKKDHEVGSFKSIKKVIPPPKWPHLRMFGC